MQRNLWTSESDSNGTMDCSFTRQVATEKEKSREFHNLLHFGNYDFKSALSASIINLMPYFVFSDQVKENKIDIDYPLVG